jgi:hypothetical protein
MRFVFKLLTFRLTREEMLQFTPNHFWIGLLGTWIVGMGRYWDDDRARILQHLGLGSVIYIFVLSLFVWLIAKPFLIEKWTYRTVLTFISLTSFPAILYAIPVEKFFDIQTANEINVWFLAAVAVWRLSLLFYFFKKYTLLSKGDVATLTFMPICIIIAVLTQLNLHQVVFNIMGGNRGQTTPHDSAYFVLILLTVVSAILTPFLLISYGVGIYFRRAALRAKNSEKPLI